MGKLACATAMRILHRLADAQGILQKKVPLGFLNDARSGRPKWILLNAMIAVFLLGPVNLSAMVNDAD